MSGDRVEFDKAWKKAFENAEIEPPKSNWEAISSALENKKSRSLVLFYKYSIAASVLIVLSLGIYFGLRNSENTKTSTQISEDLSNSQKVESKSQIRHEDLDNSVETLARSDNETNDIDITGKGEHSGSLLNGGDKKVEGNFDFSSESQVQQTISSSEVNRTSPEKSLTSTGQNFTNLVSVNQMNYLSNIDMEEPEFKPVLAEIPPVTYGYELLTKDERNKKEKVFLAGLNFSTGSFDQNSHIVQGTEGSFSDPPALNFNSAFYRYSSSVNSLGNPGELQNYDFQVTEEYTQSVAYSYGANLGMRAGKRFLIFSGLNYTRAYSNKNIELGLSQNGRVLANSFYDSSSEIAGINGDGVYEGDTQVRNEFNFISVPLKAGYTLINKKFNLTVFTGVSSEFLVQNSLSSENESNNYLANFSSGDQDINPYNKVYLNGLFSLNAGYTIGERYHIYVEPMYKRAITDFIKKEISSDQAPSFKMMMVGLSYQF